MKQNISLLLTRKSKLTLFLITLFTALLFAASCNSAEPEVQMVDVINPCSLHHNEQGDCVGPCTTQLEPADACTFPSAKACMDAFEAEIQGMESTQRWEKCYPKGCDHLTELTNAFNAKVKQFWEGKAGGVLHMDKGNQYNSVQMPGLQSGGNNGFPNSMRYCIPVADRNAARAYALGIIDELHGGQL